MSPNAHEPDTTTAVASESRLDFTRASPNPRPALSMRPTVIPGESPCFEPIENPINGPSSDSFTM